MSGTTVQNQTVVSTPLPSDHVFVNTGDYNGDGRDDILWANGGTDLHLWTSTGNSVAQTRVGDIPAGWFPAE
jgi:hypothetical protein